MPLWFSGVTRAFGKQRLLMSALSTKPRQVAIDTDIEVKRQKQAQLLTQRTAEEAFSERSGQRRSVC